MTDRNVCPTGKLEPGLDLHAETGLGEIATKFPISVEGTISHELRGKVRGGGQLVPFQFIRARRGGHLAEPTRQMVSFRASANRRKKLEGH